MRMFAAQFSFVSFYARGLDGSAVGGIQHLYDFRMVWPFEATRDEDLRGLAAYSCYPFLVGRGFF